jgi:hypothetical protein
MSAVESVVIRAKDFDPSKVTFGEFKANDKVAGAKTALVMYEGKRLLIQTDVMSTTFGINPYNAIVGKDKSQYVTNPALRDDPGTNWSMDLIFDPSTKTFHDSMVKLQECVVKHCVNKKLPGKNGKPMDTRSIEERLAPLVRVGKTNPNNGQNYPSSLKVKISRRDGRFMPAAYNENKEIITEELDSVVRAGSTVIAIIEIPQLFVTAASISLTMRLSQLKVKSTRKKGGYNFIDEDDDSCESSEPASNNVPASATQVGNSDEEVEEEADDAEDVEEEADEDAEEEEPEPVVVKKGVRTIKK